jgi:peptidoglycan/xylan/chitin deacetylase (PgdA/CDA1 family)
VEEIGVSVLGGLGARIRHQIGRQEGLTTAILKIIGAIRPLDTVQTRVFYLCYHDVPDQYLASFRSGLTALKAVGGFLSWDDALRMLSGIWPTSGPHFCLTFDDASRSWVEGVLPILTQLAIPATFFVTTGWVGQPVSDSGALSWSGCQQLADANMTIGSHTVTHRALADLDERAARGELRDSKRELEDRLGRAVVDFGAPYGQPGITYLHERDVALAREEGYRSFASTVTGAMQPGGSPYQIRRLAMRPAWPALALLGRLHSGSPRVPSWC